MSDDVTEQLLSKQSELEGKLKEANDKCDMWYATLELADKIELMGWYYQQRENNRYYVRSENTSHVWETAVNN